MTTPTFDALIIGGGPGGATVALLLAKAGWSVGLVEKMRFPRGKVCGEFLSVTNLPLLRHLGVAESFLELAGPDVSQVGLFSGDDAVTSDMPRPRTRDGMCDGWGRALGRDHLDTLLLDRAAAAGASVWQPWSAVELINKGSGYLCHVVSRERGQSGELLARIVVAAHGSWEPGPLPTQPARPASRPSDLFGFKAHFLDSRLPAGLMPLLAFPGGYAGMVHSDHGRVSLSCCIRRDQLESARRGAGPVKAGEAVLAHIKQSCRAAREALAGARLEDQWLAAGPIRPGIRRCGFDGIFLVGNAAGEAHPVVAEGIGMAMQSAWLLCEYLTAGPVDVLSGRVVDAVRDYYSTAWRRTLAPRIHAARLIAHWAMRPAAVACVLPLLRLFPGVLTAGARLSGKATSVNRPLVAARSLTS
ncbi:MAG TPA: NAD(P)/FAD-dependent oxidoreductase [Terriglobia bacterium]|nr:NAD(P)/FAD-dependent oxidoreductase [Terriglobia bacterium]